MTVDREIIHDLLPLYQSGLASAPSRRLVEEWLAANPGESAAGAIETEGDGVAMLARARSLRRWQRRLYGIAIGLTVLCLSSEFHIESGRITEAHLLALTLPWLFAPVAVAAAACWLGYAWLKRRLL
jgi:hypothetical protein